MKKLILAGIISLALPLVHAAGSEWILDSSKLDYHVDHPFHNTVGTSVASKGKGVCGTGGCDFLVATPVNTFDSGDENRDLHMVQAVKGGKNPMVSVRVHLPAEPTASSLTADLTVNLAGKEIVYPNVTFNVLGKTADHFQVKGTIPLQLSRHDVKRPSLLGMAVKDNAPVDVVVDWKKAK